MAEKSINARIATEVMEWHIDPDDDDSWLDSDGIRQMQVCDWMPNSDLNTCYLAEDEIEKRGLWEDYQQSLYGIFRAAKNDSDPTAALFMNMDKFLIRLTPAQRCQAMLSAVSK